MKYNILYIPTGELVHVCFYGDESKCWYIPGIIVPNSNVKLLNWIATFTDFNFANGAINNIIKAYSFTNSNNPLLKCEFEILEINDTNL